MSNPLLPLPVELNHWHPVLRSAEVRKKPVAITLCNTQIVVFRDSNGKVGALLDRCPHRGMQLSKGRVDGNGLVCPYHAWSWYADGSGKSPANPEMNPCINHFDTIERHGAVWIKNPNSHAKFPRFLTEGFRELLVHRVEIEAPLQLLLDNFIEVEHTGEIHLFLGYDTQRLDEVNSQVYTTDNTVRVKNVGPQKPMPSFLKFLLGYKNGWMFVDDWTTFFSPLYTSYDHYWEDPATGEVTEEMLRSNAFFLPISDTRSSLFVFIYQRAMPWSRMGLASLLRPIMRWIAREEVRRDKKLVESLVDKRTDLRKNPLGRFDKALMLSRGRLESIYRAGNVDAEKISEITRPQTHAEA
ncbi:MAG: Rieske 2Fe-2S domain-containing protein [Polyangiales bacterium]